ncbi:MAG TPA: YCF48-related protein, partial [Bacteroidia bacterium]|nr:YCF48-related protein [Bacteroidia bacterium]
ITSPVLSVFFMDTLTGFIGSDGGILKKTTDGGSTWSSYPLPSYNNPVLDIIFSDSLNGFFITTYDFYRTIDGGITWSKVGQELNKVSYLSKDTLVAVGDDVFRKSFDGGYTWTETHPFNRIHMYDMDFVDKDTGYASGYFGAIFKTINGGNNWTKQTTNSSALFSGIHFFNYNKGIAVGSNYSIARTSNGGLNWVVDSFANGSLYGYYDVFFVNDSLGYICGSQGKIARSTNGGTSFTTLTTGTTKYLLNILFLNPAKGFAVGESGTLLQTLDSGNTWTKINLGTSLYLPSIAFADSMHGYVGTEYGDFYVTTDGGLTWKGKLFNAGAINDIAFFDAYNGYTVGELDYKAKYDPLKAFNGYNDWCKGGGFNIKTLVPGNVTIDTGNVFLIEMDTIGNNFKHAMVLGAVASDTSGQSVMFNIPQTLHTGYYQARLRATKTQPVNTSLTATVRLFDSPSPTIFISNDTLYTAYHTGYSYQWRFNFAIIPNEH